MMKPSQQSRRIRTGAGFSAALLSTCFGRVPLFGRAPIPFASIAVAEEKWDCPQASLVRCGGTPLLPNGRRRFSAKQAFGWRARSEENPHAPAGAYFHPAGRIFHNRAEEAPAVLP